MISLHVIWGRAGTCFLWERNQMLEGFHNPLLGIRCFTRRFERLAASGNSWDFCLPEPASIHGHRIQ